MFCLGGSVQCSAVQFSMCLFYPLGVVLPQPFTARALRVALYVCSTRNAMEEDLNQSLRQSFWTRSFPINPLYIIGGLVVIAVYVILPIYLYTARLKDVCCDPDVGTSLACNATDAAAGQVAGDVPVGTSDDEVTATFRKLMTPAVDAVADQIGSYIGGRGSQQQGSGSDAWSQYVARG